MIDSYVKFDKWLYVKIGKQIISFVLENFWKMIWFTRNLMKNCIQFIFSFQSSFVRCIVYFSILSQILYNLFKLTKKKRIFKRVFNEALWTYIHIKIFLSYYLEILLFSIILKYVVESIVCNFIKKIFVKRNFKLKWIFL